VQPHPDCRMLCQMLEKWKVGLLVNFLQNRIEVAHRLVAVNEKNQMVIRQDWTAPV